MSTDRREYFRALKAKQRAEKRQANPIPQCPCGQHRLEGDTSIARGLCYICYRKTDEWRASEAERARKTRKKKKNQPRKNNGDQ